MIEILFLTVSGVISSSDSWPDIVLFGQYRLDWLRKFFPYRYGIPSHDTLERVFGALDPAVFGKWFMQWASACFCPLADEVVSIDGKRICGSGGKQGQGDAVHMVSAYASINRLTLGQLSVFDKSNEITAIPELLELLDTKGCLVSIDAMGCQRKIAGKILDKGSDYLLAVKENQGELLEQTEKMFSIRIPCESHQDVDVGHGRVETRECSIIRELDFMDMDEPWPELNTLVRIRSERYFKKSGETQRQTRYYISSRKQSALQFNGYVRNHWAIENNLHWQLDVNFGEDAAQRRNVNIVKNFNIILKVCLRMIEKQEGKLSKKRKRMAAILDDEFREQVLGFF